ncbi:DUF4760 domain-containing protein [Actinoplanes sp. RD1]|uniref:DUF4760 domain-containing protein n=1 Tax=Actinoplanes sp. RD1 TaxID=3064538 RepID=UPI00274052CF|nr:DUF4760 domain-containing protein [Actinoplanes sp. RD1]
MLSFASLVVAALALLVSAGVAWRQLNYMRHGTMLPVALDMFAEFRTPQFRTCMRYLTEDLHREHPPGEEGILSLPDDVRALVVPAVSYFNNLGLLVAQRVVDPDVVRGFMNHSILRAWDRTAPYIRVERARRNDPAYYQYFEHLAAVCLRPGKAPELDKVPDGWSYDVTPYVRPRKPAS